VILVTTVFKAQIQRLLNKEANSSEINPQAEILEMEAYEYWDKRNTIF